MYSTRTLGSQDLPKDQDPGEEVEAATLKTNRDKAPVFLDSIKPGQLQPPQPDRKETFETSLGLMNEYIVNKTQEEELAAKILSRVVKENARDNLPEEREKLMSKIRQDLLGVQMEQSGSPPGPGISVVLVIL